MAGLRVGVVVLLVSPLSLPSSCPAEGQGEEGGGCGCATSRDASSPPLEPPAGKYQAPPAAAAFVRTHGMLAVPGGRVTVGTDSPFIPADLEGPARTLTLDPFFLDEHEVSNNEFGLFVEQTEYVTEAETFGNSFVAEYYVAEEVRAGIEEAVAAAPWWLPVAGASWRRPEGGTSGLAGRGEHPVVHVSWHDAAAYCAWAGKRLPREAEWEAACRAGKAGRLYSWGNLWTPGGAHRANTWQGEFPATNTAEDGWEGAAPVTAFPATALGHRNLLGNVWEWVDDWWAEGNTAERTKKGGSFMCHKSYCYRYSGTVAHLFDRRLKSSQFEAIFIAICLQCANIKSCFFINLITQIYVYS